MARILPVAILFLVPAIAAFPQKRNANPVQNFSIQQLAKGVWAAIHNDQYGRAICNAGIVDLGDKTLVFDPFMNPRAAAELRETAEQLTGKPVTIVVNSHYHNDHTRGNQAFAPFATIISTNYTRNRMAEVAPEEYAWERKHAASMLKATRQRHNAANGFEKQELCLWIGYYEGMVESLEDFKITLPDIVFQDSLWILGSERDVKLMEFKNGHTGSDVVLCIPSERIAFLGDLLFVQRHPWLADGEPASWQATLKNLYEDKFMQTYVPGHGSVCEKAGVKDLYDYLGKMQELAAEAAKDTLQTAAPLPAIPPQYGNWFFGRFYQPNMQFLLNNITRRKETLPE
ncbi:MAG TPA: MBL fold metallo-hydrolase [Chitinophagaceae bacterium]|nr:MBL fold metallo-hydrolase [Chitinophagaceae bacterium]